jgi:3-hydroxyisobutyrate dehydrogenase-like beta-hydroxyacid dehydrogenase
MSARDRQVGVIGLGLVGSAIAARLGAAGYAVSGYDIRGEALAALQKTGATPLASPRAVAAAAPIVLLAVFDTDQVETAAEGEDGITGAEPKPAYVINLATADPARIVALAERLERHGITLIEAPLSGSSEEVASGKAAMLLGGDVAAIEACAGVLAAVAAVRMHAGGIGMGAKAKLATNLVLGLNRAALAEGMVFAEKLGIAPDKFLQLVLNSPASSHAARVRGARMAAGDFRPQSRIRQHLKDVELMLREAGALSQRLPLSEAHAELMRAAIDAGDGDLDNTAIIAQLRRAVPNN